MEYKKQRRRGDEVRTRKECKRRELVRKTEKEREN